MTRWLPLANVFTQNHKIMVKHIVTFKFKGSDEVRKEIARKFADALMALPAQIAELKSIEVGINENPKESWDLVLTATADSLEDVAIYSAHPAHVAAVQIIAPYKEDRACVDFSFWKIITDYHRKGMDFKFLAFSYWLIVDSL